MKRLMIILFAIGMTTMSSTCMAGMSKSRVRKEARFLSDKMAYELNLSAGQRNDAYEINYDFIYSVRDLMDDLLYGEEWAMDRYYYLLDIRNDDLRWVLSDYQYRRFMNVDYFYRPIYASGNKWNFRIYFTYTNHNHFFFGKPYHYTSYHYNHYRYHYDHVSHYHNKYSHNVYRSNHSVRDNRVYSNNRKSDFSSVRILPNTSTPKGTVSTTRRSSSSNSSATRNNSGTYNSSSSRSSNSGSSTRSSGSNTNSSNSSRRSSSSTESTRSNSSSGTSTRSSNSNTGTSTRSNNSSTSTRSSSSASPSSSTTTRSNSSSSSVRSGSSSRSSSSGTSSSSSRSSSGSSSSSSRSGSRR